MTGTAKSVEESIFSKMERVLGDGWLESEELRWGIALSGVSLSRWVCARASWAAARVGLLSGAEEPFETGGFSSQERSRARMMKIPNFKADGWWFNAAEPWICLWQSRLKALFFRRGCLR